jgi:hypothetical protein
MVRAGPEAPHETAIYAAKPLDRRSTLGGTTPKATALSLANALTSRKGAGTAPIGLGSFAPVSKVQRVVLYPQVFALFMLCILIELRCPGMTVKA